MKPILSLFFLVTIFAQSTFGEVLNSAGSIKSEIVELFQLFSPYIKKHSDFDIEDAVKNPDLETFNKIAQKLFLRPASAERLSQKSIEHYKNLTTDLSEEQILKVLDIMKQIGDLEAVYPKYKKYDYILIQGSTVQNMRERVMFLANLVESNKIDITKSKILFLAGERRLFASETQEVLEDTSPYKLSKDFIKPQILPSDEIEAAKMVWSQLELPKKLRKNGITFVEARKKTNSPRATTEDCINKWLDIDAQPGLTLVVSSNPFVFYQKRVIEIAASKRYFDHKKHFTFDGMGPAVQYSQYSNSELIGVLMDSIARVIYLENKSKQTNQQ